jgi:hypothetical protein
MLRQIGEQPAHVGIGEAHADDEHRAGIEQRQQLAVGPGGVIVGEPVVVEVAGDELGGESLLLGHAGVLVGEVAVQVDDARPVGEAASAGVNGARLAAAGVLERHLEQVVVVGRVQHRERRLGVEGETHERVVRLGGLELAQLLALVEGAAQHDVEIGADPLAHQIDRRQRLPLEQLEVGAADGGRLRGAAGGVASHGLLEERLIEGGPARQPDRDREAGTDEKSEATGAMLLAHLAQDVTSDVG